MGMKSLFALIVLFFPFFGHIASAGELSIEQNLEELDENRWPEIFRQYLERAQNLSMRIYLGEAQFEKLAKQDELYKYWLITTARQFLDT